MGAAGSKLRRVLCYCLRLHANHVSSPSDTLPARPAAHSPAVAALTAADTLPSFSSYGGTSVHLAAPGVNILSTFNTADNAYTMQSGAR